MAGFRPYCETLVCIYTCEAHRGILREFHLSPLGRFLKQWKGAQIIEVYADDSLYRPHASSRRVILNCREDYTQLSFKTLLMMRYCVKQFKFTRLLKIDVTTVMTDLSAPEYAGRKPLSQPALIAFLRDADTATDYNGFICHTSADRNGAESWAAKKGLCIDYESLFGDSCMPAFYSGKCYFVGIHFAKYIAIHGYDYAEEHSRLLAGAEDVMVGRLFREFQCRTSSRENS
ncbi:MULTISPECIES: hypothetical protein [Aphanothece]|uniref:hypothetical protein n=1 Tax=Aphanothece TaxID=1121 RepID=UPI003984E344